MKRLLFLLACLSFVASAVHAQNAVPTYPVDGQYMREWLVLGPFFPDNLETDFLTDVGGEANIYPKEGDTVTTAEGMKLTWKRYEAKGNSADLSDVIGYHEHATAYAFCVLRSEVADDASVCLGHSNGAVLWLNGQRVYGNPIDAARDQSVFEVNLKADVNRCLVKVSQKLGTWAFAMRAFPPNNAIISGVITGEKGKPIFKASVRLQQDGEKIAQVQTDESGSYCLGLYPVHGSYHFSATSGGDLGAQLTGFLLREGERRRLNFSLKKAISIEGVLMMLDDITPHVAVLVEAMMVSGDNAAGRVVATALSDDEGKYRFVNLAPGRYQVRCQILGEYAYYGEGKNSLGEQSQIKVELGKSQKNIDFRFAPFKEGTWQTYDTLDGLADNGILDIHRGKDGVMWFGTLAGASCYDGKEFINLTSKDGLAGNWVFAIHVDPDGVLWFGTNGGVSRYDGKKIENFTTEDGLVSNVVKTIYRAPNGLVWFGTGWWNIAGGGVSVYDGKEFENFTTKDGLAHNTIKAICSDSDGVMWFGMWGDGVCRYDGKDFVNFTEKDGLAGNGVYAIHQAPDGSMWFGTLGGVSHYDGQTFLNFTAEDGLAHNSVYAIHQAPDGSMWFGTKSGVSRYDDLIWTSLDSRDGLAGNRIRSIHGDLDGSLWFGSEGGLTRYRKSTIPPRVQIISVTTDQTYRDLSAIEACTPGMRVTIAYNAIDLVTVPEKRQYRIRIKERDNYWHTQAASFDYIFDKPGTYTFSVQAIDRDLNYSKPASVTLKVILPFYLRASFLVLTVAGGIILVAVLILVSIGYLRRRQQLKTAQGQLIIQEKMASLGSLVAGVAHEMNNPIGAIHSAADVANRVIRQIKTLLQTTEANDNERKLQQSLELLEGNHQVIGTASTRIATIVRSLRSFARLDEAIFQQVDIHEGIDITLTLMHHELKDKVTIIKEYEQIPRIYCYPHELNQVWMNLLRNAIQAIEPKGSPGLSGRRRIETIKIATSADETQVYVRISDTGKGIPAANLKQIFDPGFTTRGAGVGLGLGLSISYNIIQEHKGEITVESEVGKGTQVVITLPIKVDETRKTTRELSRRLQKDT